jgi:hypothetical protein
MEVNGQLHAMTALPMGKECPWYTLESRLGEPWAQSGMLWSGGKFIFLLGIKPHFISFSALILVPALIEV